MMKRTTRLAPKDAKTEQQVRQLKRKSYQAETAWISVESNSVFICEQVFGTPALGRVILQRKTFDAMIRWYFREQECDL